MTDAMAQEYGYFAIGRPPRGVLTYPDGSKQLFEDQTEAKQAWERHVETHLLATERAAVERRRAEFAVGCEVRIRKVRPQGFFSVTEIYRDLVDPEGKFLSPADEDVDAQVAEIALEKIPDPSLELVAEKADGGVRPVVVWSATLYLNGKRERLPACDVWEYGFPVDHVIGVLNRLATDGWSVSHVSEDRGVYRGVTNHTDSAVTTARFLLTRSH